MDIQDTLEKMLAAARIAAGAHWNDVRDYLKNEFEQAAEAYTTQKK